MANNKNKSMNPAVAGVVGAVVGATTVAAGVGAALLYNKDTRKKVQKMGEKAYNEVKDKIDEAKGEAEKKTQE